MAPDLVKNPSPKGIVGLGVGPLESGVSVRPDERTGELSQRGILLAFGKRIDQGHRGDRVFRGGARQNGVARFGPGATPEEIGQALGQHL